MWRLAARLFLTIWLAGTLAFFALHILPGDAVEGLLVRNGATPEAVEQRRAALGLTAPLLQQYARFFLNMLKGDLGVSLVDGQPVGELIVQRFLPTMSLALSAMIIAVVLGLTLGLAGAVQMGWGISSAARLVIDLAIGVPIYWSATVALVVFTALSFSSKWSEPILAALPIVVLGFHTSGAVARSVFVNVKTVQEADFVQTARAKGLPEAYILRLHILRVAMLPVISVIALQSGYLLGGAIFTESIFVRPGIGLLLLDRALLQDYPVVQGIVVLGALLYSALTACADLLQRWLDPRLAA
jgi:peptide/nickel transport system permease protein